MIKKIWYLFWYLDLVCDNNYYWRYWRYFIPYLIFVFKLQYSSKMEDQSKVLQKWSFLSSLVNRRFASRNMNLGHEEEEIIEPSGADFSFSAT